MLSYSPYDNVKKQDYPSLLITAGLNDPRVAYWEPAKWCCKLREYKTDKNPLIFKTDLSSGIIILLLPLLLLLLLFLSLLLSLPLLSGHFSASDRYKYLHEASFEYSWIIDQICK